jgi:hypothetical protein
MIEAKKGPGIESGPTAGQIIEAGVHDTAERFMKLYSGSTLSYGVHVPDGVENHSVTGKRSGISRTVTGSVNAALYDAHLAGEQGLGIVPVRADGTCVWGVIDIDRYDTDFNPAKVAVDLLGYGLPLIVCRSKSGGAHVYLFCESASASLMRARLSEIANLLGHKAEVFPKSDGLDNSLGNWVNLPYFNGDAGTRCAVLPNAEGLSVTQFLDLAERLRVEAAWLRAPLSVGCDLESESPQAERPARTPIERLLPMAMDKIHSGEPRNNSGLFLCCQLRDAGYDRSEGRSVLRDFVRLANEATPGQPQYTWAEANDSLKQAYKRPARPALAGKRPNTVKVLEGLCRDIALFHSPKKEAFALVPVNDHVECIAVESKTFKGILTSRYFRAHKSTPGRDAMQSFVDLSCARAVLDGPERETFLRFAHVEQRSYLDLGNAEWSVVEIGGDGWRVLQESPVCFRRAGGMKPLPMPERGGNLETLRGFINAQEDSQWVLLASWLLGAFLPKGGFPILLLQGIQGSAKSTTAAILRSVIDPATVPLSAPPRDERELAIAAVNSGIVAFDNLSGVHPWLSDALCRIATGAGFRTRTLHTDSDEQLFETRRPLLLNGIDDLASRADLLDRGIGVTLGRISDECRKTETEVYAGFHAAHAAILGAVLTAVSQGLRDLAETRLSSMPRMSDFAKFLVACEPALPWKPGAFMREYLEGRQQAAENSVENDPVARALWTMAQNFRKGVWEGRAEQLLSELNQRIPHDRRDAMKSWPTTPASLGRWLRRAEPGLRAVGITLTASRKGKARMRLLRIEYLQDQIRLSEPEAA